MAIRPLTFGMRFRDDGRTVRLRANRRDPGRYVVEVERRSAAQAKTDRRDYPSLTWALGAFARTWRSRLN